MAGERKKIYGRGANECKMCGRKQGLRTDIARPIGEQDDDMR